MSRFLLLVLLLMTAAANQGVTKTGMPLVIEAEVITPAETVPPAGIVHALQVDRYRVLRVVSGSYEAPELFAARESGTPFKVGDRLRLTLSPELPNDAAPLITDPVEVARVGLFYCSRSKDCCSTNGGRLTDTSERSRRVYEDRRARSDTPTSSLIHAIHALVCVDIETNNVQSSGSSFRAPVETQGFCRGHFASSSARRNSGRRGSSGDSGAGMLSRMSGCIAKACSPAFH